MKFQIRALPRIWNFILSLDYFHIANFIVLQCFAMSYHKAAERGSVENISYFLSFYFPVFFYAPIIQNQYFSIVAIYKVLFIIFIRNLCNIVMLYISNSIALYGKNLFES